MKPLLVRAKPGKPIEAVCWVPDQRGNQKGGWPRTKRWAVAKAWTVSAVDLTLYIEQQTPGVRPGDWILRMPNGRFVWVPQHHFLLLYDLAE